ncbi:MAG: Rrf2 family transcriptional regulator [Lachnospiraceae bacterium]|nr:Rrf2 family transcriptional regulator [Lachnospiraceae bacterium]MBR2530145.1 Rrf2 family transcriptional regulator [Lachnospiraceae bacterium]
MISTRGRYALRVMIDIGLNQDDGFVPMKEVAQRQGLSLKYLEQILPALTKNGLVQGMHGKGGGYRLTRKPEDYRIGEILRLTEKDLAPVSCLAEGAAKCDRMPKCKTIAFWKGLNEVTNEYLDSKTLLDLMEE